MVQDFIATKKKTKRFFQSQQNLNCLLSRVQTSVLVQVHLRVDAFLFRSFSSGRQQMVEGFKNIYSQFEIVPRKEICF